MKSISYENDFSDVLNSVALVETCYLNVKQPWKVWRD